MNNSNENIPNQKPKRSRKKLFLLGLGALGLGMLTFFSIRFWKTHKKENVTNPSPEIKIKKEAPKATKATNKATKPKEKPKSAKGATPPPKGASKPINAAILAKAIHTTVTKKDFNKSLLFLMAIKNIADYSAVNKVFSQFLVGGVRQTLVTGLLNTYKDEKQKQALRQSFTRMGLKYNGKKWSLSGVDDTDQIITTTKTKVWKDPRTAVTVPINMVLGREVCKRGEHTLFENDDQYFLVESNTVKAYQA